MSTQPDARTALATRRDQQEQGGTIAVPLDARIKRLEPSFAMALPKGAEAVRFIRDALTCLRTVRDLDKCDPDSVLGALMTCAQLGLRPGVLGHAWPLPYWDGRAGHHRAQLVIGYQGLIELGHRSGQISSLIARVVYQRDHFDVDYGLADSLIHKPNLREDRGAPIAYYAIAKFTSGGHAFIVMSHKDVEQHRDRYAPRNKQQKIVGPWVDSFEAMALKTVIRQLAKYMPKSTELAEAVAADGGVRIDVSPDVPASDVTGTGQAWDGQVVDDRTDPVAELAAAPPVHPGGEVAEAMASPDWPKPAEVPTADLPDVETGPKLATDAQIRGIHAGRNKIEAFSGNSAEAKELFLVHVATLLNPPREIKTLKELTISEASDVIEDLIERRKRQDLGPVPGETAPAAKPTSGTMTTREAMQRLGESEPATAEEAGF